MADYSVGGRNQIGQLRMSEANRRPLDSAGHDRAEEDRPPGLFSLVRGPIGLVVAGEGFEPSKAKPTDLQSTSKPPLTSTNVNEQPGCPDMVRRVDTARLQQVDVFVAAPSQPTSCPAHQTRPQWPVRHQPPS